MKRKAETLIEIVTAMMVFGVISYGVFDFMAVQTLHLARVRGRENMLFAAQKLIACSSVDVDVNRFTRIPDTDVVYTLHDKVLTLKKGEDTMTLSVQ